MFFPVSAFFRPRGCPFLRKGTNTSIITVSSQIVSFSYRISLLVEFNFWVFGVSNDGSCFLALFLYGRQTGDIHPLYIVYHISLGNGICIYWILPPRRVAIRKGILQPLRTNFQYKKKKYIKYDEISGILLMEILNCNSNRSECCGLI